jgi:uncharacterized protein YbjT (DUF2867 family)
MLPPDYQFADYVGRYRSLGEAAATAITNAGVKHVVFLSSLGGQHDAGTGPVVGLHQVEERLKQIPGINLLILRAGYFYENAFGAIGMIKQMGINGGVIAPDVPVAMTSTLDIGAAAADALVLGDFQGTTVREVLGPRTYTMAQVTKILGAAIGKPDLPYVTFSDDDYRKGLVGAGFANELAQSFVEMSHAINDGRMSAVQNDSRTGVVTFEEFAHGFTAAYAAA